MRTTFRAVSVLILALAAPASAKTTFLTVILPRPPVAAPSHCLAEGSRVDPVRLADAGDRFRGALSGAALADLDAALPRAPDGHVAACLRRDGSYDVQCAASLLLPAIRSAGLMAAFEASVCP